MIKKTLNPTNGLRGTTQTYQHKKGKERNVGIDSPDKIKNCLGCNKPEKECKGACYGRD
jgi:hypothetical protein